MGPSKALRLIAKVLREYSSNQDETHRTLLSKALKSIDAVVSAKKPNRADVAYLESEFVIPIDRANALAAAYWRGLFTNRRIAAQLDLITIAERSGVPEETLQALENGLVAPSLSALAHLMSVEQLDMNLTRDWPVRVLLTGQTSLDTDNKWLVTPSYDSIRMIRKLKKVILSKGDHLEQSYLYVDHASASDWCRISKLDDYDVLQATIPFDQVATVISSMGMDTYDVIVLGPGDGHSESNLLGELARKAEFPNFRVFLLDISQALLCVSYPEILSTVSRFNLPVFPILGDFRKTSCFRKVFKVQGHSRRRLITMLGHTISNLTDDLAYFQKVLSVVPEGDLLLLDFRLGYAPSNDREAIRRADPAFVKGPKTRLQRARNRFLLGPVFRYGPRDARVVLRPALVLNTGMPGSYRVEFRAFIKQARRRRWCSVYFSRRYEPEPLLEAIANEGWYPIEVWRYGSSKTRCLLALLIKLGSREK